MNPETLFKVNYGMYIVSSLNKQGCYNGQVANTIFQVTAEPIQVAMCINKGNLTYEYIKESGLFSLSILEQDTPMTLIGQFGFKSGRDIDKFKNMDMKTGVTGVPILLDHSIGYIECKVIDKHLDVGTHSIIVGKVEDAQILKPGEPMTYNYYHVVKKGFSPKSAPTYIKQPVKKEETKMDKYRCTVCGYIYDPVKGDPDSGIAPGTPFEKIPADWVCPVCGATKDAFEKE